MKKAVLEVVAQHFRPEFINRVDELVVFHPLDKAQIHRIALLQIQRVETRLKERDLHLEVKEEALDFLAEAGYDPVYGARPLKRAVQQYLENSLAQDILSGRFMPGDKIVVSKGAQGLVFKQERP
jgi:ATP-dependent Clp protease ATP-binding subunit ClpB